MQKVKSPFDNAQMLVLKKLMSSMMPTAMPSINITVPTQSFDYDKLSMLISEQVKLALKKKKKDVIVVDRVGSSTPMG